MSDRQRLRTALDKLQELRRDVGRLPGLQMQVRSLLGDSDDLAELFVEPKSGPESNVRAALHYLSATLRDAATELEAGRSASEQSLIHAFDLAADKISALFRAQPMWGTSEEEIAAQVGEILVSGGYFNCQQCGAEFHGISIQAARLIVSALSQQSLPQPPPFVPTAIVTCTTCGAMRFYHLPTLGIL